MTIGRRIARRLLEWYQTNGRQLPWRMTSDPYAIVVSEFMLHQTRVATVIPYYERFVSEFPTWQALADSPLDAVLKAWEGLGYYARARNLHAVSRAVHSQFGDALPDKESALRQLPGVGEYTARVLLSIVHGQDFIAIDGNARRVLSRLFAVNTDPMRGEGKRQVRDYGASLLIPGRTAELNQALMDMGATLCTPRRPACALCPVSSECAARKHGLQEVLPIRPRRKKVPHYDIGAGIVWHHGRILIAKRPAKGLLGGLWEFPGGKCEEGEALSHCVVREIQEELGIEVEINGLLAAVEHAYTHMRVTLHFFQCTFVTGPVQAIGCDTWRWVKPEELIDYPFPAANRTVIAALSALDP